MKVYNIMHNVGKAKYVVNHFDGVKQHKDGSAFYDLSIFRNKKDLASFESELTQNGYIYK